MKNLKKEKEEAVNEATKFLRNGKIIIYPTDTVYGIGANATNKKAIKKVYNLKKRSKDKPISIMVSDKEMINKYAKVNHISSEIIEEFLPGPLTILLPKMNLPDELTANQEKVGVRLIRGPIREIINKLDHPITATSANISGNTSSRKFSSAIKNLSVDLALDGGECPGGIPSTVFDPEEWKVIREGPIKKKDIEEVTSFSH